MLRPNAWYTYGSKSERELEYTVRVEICNIPTAWSIQVRFLEVYAILQCARNIKLRSQRKVRISTFTDSQAAFWALRKPKSDNKIDLEMQSNILTLYWVPGNSEIIRNEKANECALHASLTSYIGPSYKYTWEQTLKNLRKHNIKKWAC